MKFSARRPAFLPAIRSQLKVRTQPNFNVVESEVGHSNGGSMCAEFRKLTFDAPAYTRKVDLRVANALSAFGATVQKITGDIRHLASQKEMEE